MRFGRTAMHFLRLGWNRQAMLAEALAAVFAASVAIRLMPFARAVRLGCRRVAAPRSGDRGQIQRDVRWSVMTVARRVPWRAVCFQQGIALQWMLRRRGIDARLHYGVGPSDGDSLRAHVWVSAGDSIVIGGEEAPNYRAVAAYP